jgi:hypothetical protein
MTYNSFTHKPQRVYPNSEIPSRFQDVSRGFDILCGEGPGESVLHGRFLGWLVGGLGSWWAGLGRFFALGRGRCVSGHEEEREKERTCMVTVWIARFYT